MRYKRCITLQQGFFIQEGRRRKIPKEAKKKVFNSNNDFSLPFSESMPFLYSSLKRESPAAPAAPLDRCMKETEKNYCIPSEKECMEIMSRYEMLPNIKDHSIQVRNVSAALVDNLKESTSIDRDLVLCGALLHDIAKTRTIKTRELRHDLIGGEMLRELNLEALAEICESHVFFDDFDFEGPLEAREIVYYADKRVMHDTVVSLDERVDDLAKRYGKNDKLKEMIRRNKDFVLRIEEKIQRYMAVEIDEALAGL